MRRKLFKQCVIFLSVLITQVTTSALIMAQTITFSYTGNVQTYTVPAGVTNVTISASGAQGGGNAGGGLGALMSGDFAVTPGETIYIVVGQQGQLQIGGQSQNSSGGGGGSFVYRNANMLLLAAGGGGGLCNYGPAGPAHPDAHGKTTPNGGSDQSGVYLGGIAGAGGSAGLWSNTPCAGGGTGWLSAGGGPHGGGDINANWAAGLPFCGGGGGGCGGYGGYGGGGGGGNHYGGGGGGGGYSGGGGGTDPTHGGGGGSFNGGINQVNIAGTNQGNGIVTITLPNCISPVVTLNNAIVCQGESATVTAVATPAGNYTYIWMVPNGVPSPGNTSSVTSTVGGTYTVVAVDANNPNCPSDSTNATITVNPLPIVNAGPDVSICEGDTVVLSANGAAQYAWDNGVVDNVPFAPSSNGTYTVNGVDLNGCMGADTLELTILNHSTSSLTETAIDSYTLNGQTYTQSGIYTQVVPAANGCDSTITLDLTLNYTGLNELPHSAKSLIRITDLNGKLIPRRKNTLMLFIYNDGTVERVMEYGE